MARREQFALDVRKSRKKDLIAHRRELYSYKTPVERSVSPMFGGRDEASLVDGNVDEEEKGGHDIPRDDLNEEESF